MQHQLLANPIRRLHSMCKLRQGQEWDTLMKTDKWKKLKWVGKHCSTGFLQHFAKINGSKFSHISQNRLFVVSDRITQDGLKTSNADTAWYENGLSVCVYDVVCMWLCLNMCNHFLDYRIMGGVIKLNTVISSANRVGVCVCVCSTFGVEGDEAVTQGPFVHGLVENDVLREDDHSDVLKPAQTLQNLGHGLWLGLLHHGTDAHHDLSLRRLRGGGDHFIELGYFVYWRQSWVALQPVNQLVNEMVQQLSQKCFTVE